MNELLELFKSLGDETRLRILLRLLEKPHCVCELTDILDLSQPKVSKHLSKLRDLGYVETLRDAQFVIYKLNPNHQKTIKLLQFIRANYKDYPTLVLDATKQSSCAVDLKQKKLERI